MLVFHYAVLISLLLLSMCRYCSVHVSIYRTPNFMGIFNYRNFISRHRESDLSIQACLLVSKRSLLSSGILPIRDSVSGISQVQLCMWLGRKHIHIWGKSCGFRVSLPDSVAAVVCSLRTTRCSYHGSVLVYLFCNKLFSCECGSGCVCVHCFFLIF